MKRKEFSKIQQHIGKRAFVMPKNNRKVVEIIIKEVHTDYMRCELLKGEYRSHEEGEAFALGKNEIKELYIVPKWVEKDTEVKITHKFSHPNKITKLRGSEILYGGGYIAAWAEDISGAFEVQFMQPTNKELIEPIFVYNQHEINIQ